MGLTGMVRPFLFFNVLETKFDKMENKYKLYINGRRVGAFFTMIDAIELLHEDIETALLYSKTFPSKKFEYKFSIEAYGLDNTDNLL